MTPGWGGKQEPDDGARARPAASSGNWRCVPSEVVEDYRTLLKTVDDWFARAAAFHVDEVHCHQGCTACCEGLFDISALDAALVAKGVEALAPERQEVLAQAADAVLEEVREAAPDWDEPWDVDALGDDAFDEVCKVIADRPCPVLAEDGSCTIYENRPLICRIHGIPMYDPTSHSWLGGECERNLGPDGRRGDRVLWFNDLRFESGELALTGRLAEDLPRRTVMAAVVLLVARDLTNSQR